MTPVPVVAILREAYRFTFTHLGAIIGLVWLPMVLVTVMGFFSAQNFYSEAIEALANNNAAQLGPSLLLWFGYILAALLLMAMMYVAVVQLALGQPGTAGWVHFAFGALEWRMLRALLAFVGLLIPVMFLGGILANAAALRAPPAAPLVSLLMQVVMLGFVARFFLLLPAIAVMETQPVLRRAWQLSAGNFWRLLAILLGFVIPLFLLAILLLVPVAMRIPPPPPPGSASLQMQQLAMFVWLRQALPYLCGLMFFIWPVVMGLFASASVSAWRALKTEPVVDIEA